MKEGTPRNWFSEGGLAGKTPGEQLGPCLLLQRSLSSTLGLPTDCSDHTGSPEHLPHWRSADHGLESHLQTPSLQHPEECFSHTSTPRPGAGCWFTVWRAVSRERAEPWEWLGSQGGAPGPRGPAPPAASCTSLHSYPVGTGPEALPHPTLTCPRLFLECPPLDQGGPVPRFSTSTR